MSVVSLVTPLREGPTLAGPAGKGRFLVDGGSVAVTGERRGAVDSIRMAGREVVRALRVEPGTAVNVVAHPGLIRRERVGPSGTTTETIIAAPSQPLVAVQLDSAAGLTLRFELVLPAGGAPPRVEGRRVRVVLDEDLELAAELSTPNAKLAVHEPTATGVVIEARATAPGPLTLLIAAGATARVDKWLASAAHLAVSAHAAAQAYVEEGIALETGVTEIDEGVHWARARLARALTRAEHVGSASDVLLAGLASAAVGDAMAARDAAGYVLAQVHRGRATWNDASLLASRVAMAFGDAGPALHIARQRADAGASVEGDLDPAVAEALADALRYAAPEALIDAVRRASRSVAPGTGSAGSGRRLPMAGRVDGRHARLARLLAGTAGASDGGAGPEAGAIDLAAELRSDPDAGWVRWRSVLSAGLDGGPEGPGSWDPADAASGAPVAPATSGLLLALVHGMLGFSPDAPVGRARIAPVLPSHLKALRVRGLTLGDARISFAYEREEGRHRFTLEPERGGVPPLLVFEPAVAGEVVAARVDGTTADLALRGASGRTVVPVQLPLDGARTVEVLTRL